MAKLGNGGIGEGVMLRECEFGKGVGFGLYRFVGYGNVI